MPKGGGALGFDGTPSLRVVPDTVENSGADAYVGFAVGERALTARLAGRFDGAIGEAVRLSVDTRKLCFFRTDDGTLIR